MEREADKKRTQPGATARAHSEHEHDMGHAAIPTAAGESASDRAFGAAKPDPLMMPKEIVDYEKKNMWGQHHLEWHVERQWDRFTADPQNAAYAKKQGWKRAAIQEGEKGNGLQFLAMHRSMINELKTKFPKDAHLFDGWDTPPL